MHVARCYYRQQYVQTGLAHTHGHTHACHTHTDIHTPITHTNIHTHAHTHTGTDTHAHTHTTHTHTHTHTHWHTNAHHTHTPHTHTQHNEKRLRISLCLHTQCSVWHREVAESHAHWLLLHHMWTQFHAVVYSGTCLWSLCKQPASLAPNSTNLALNIAVYLCDTATSL